MADEYPQGADDDSVHAARSEEETWSNLMGSFVIAVIKLHFFAECVWFSAWPFRFAAFAIGGPEAQQAVEDYARDIA